MNITDEMVEAAALAFLLRSNRVLAGEMPQEHLEHQDCLVRDEWGYRRPDGSRTPSDMAFIKNIRAALEAALAVAPPEPDPSDFGWVPPISSEVVTCKVVDVGEGKFIPYPYDDDPEAA